jgi:hypothetical protein
MHKANPHFEFPRILVKRTTALPADTSWSVPDLPATCSLSLTIHRKKREDVINEMVKGRRAKDAAEFRRAVANMLVLEEKVYISIVDEYGRISQSSFNGKIKFTNFHAVKPGSVVMVDAAIQFTDGPPEDAGAATSERALRHIPTDLLLVRVQSIP